MNQTAETGGIIEGDDGAAAARETTRKARELIPVGPAGVQIHDLAQQVDYAQTMARAKAALPDHLRGHVGDCLAIIDIASRAGLSPYMVANKTYVQNGRLCFESQLFHAFLTASGLIVGDLEVDYQGEGGDMICVVTGRLRSEPSRRREHRSPPLKDLHPGYTIKRYDEKDGSSAKSRTSYAEGQRKKASGEVPEGSQMFPLGSPLWDRKPRVQMFYDTSRDWIRLYCPQATLGIYTRDEMEEYGPEFARDVTPSGPGFGDRLRSNDAPKTGEGYSGSDSVAEMNKAKNGHAEPEKTQDSPASEVEKIDPSTPVTEIGLSAKTANALVKGDITSLSELLQMSETEVLAIDGIAKAGVGHIKATLEGLGYALRIDGEATPGAGETKEEVQEIQPRNVAEWKAYCTGWIKRETGYIAIRARWNNERQLRNTCGVTSDDRDPIQAIMVDRCKELGE